MKKGKIAVLLLLITSLFILTACGEKTTPTTSSNVSQEETTKIKVAHLPIPGQIIYYIADQKGYFTEENLEVEFTQIKKSADVLNALKAGKADVGSAGTAAPLLFINDNSPFVIGGGILGEGSDLVTTKEKATEIKEVKDLVGKKIGTVRLATGDIVLRAYLKRQGINEKDIEWVEFASATDSLTALKSGKVDAAISWPPYTDVEVLNGSLAVIAPTTELVPGHTCCRVVFNKDFLTNNQDAATGFFKALIKADKFFQENPEESLKFAAEALKVSTDEIRGSLVDHKTSLIDSNPNKKAIVDFWNMMKEVGYLQSDKNIADYIDSSYYKEALDQLVAENPNDQFYAEKLEEFTASN